MARRLLTIWLLISLLGYGGAVMADLHGEEAADFPSCGELTLIDDHHGDAGCDHCCHGATHLLGLIDEGAAPMTTDGVARLVAAVDDFDSHQPPIPIRPPRTL